ncbi:MAG: radical SAM protein [Candidatus Schekmanbacteria bacterium]|nr:radical SAM protein [Candidatus Schekmanbacteria bacterium]
MRTHNNPIEDYIKKISQNKYWVYFNYKFRKKVNLLTLLIEFTPICNLKCRMCTLDHSQKGFMDPLLLEEIVKQISDDSKYNIDNISLWQGGETLLHPKFGLMLDILAKAKKRSKVFPKIALLTNATVLDEKKTDIILTSDAVDLMLFSVDGGTKESFEDLRVGAKWDEVLNNINHFLKQNRDLKKNIRTGIISIIKPGLQLSEEFKKLVNSVDEYMPRSMHSWDGSEELGIETDACKEEKYGLCYFVLRELVVHWDGNVSPCCIDLNKRGILGNLNNNSLYEIYHSANRKFMIDKMQKKLRKEIELCKKCNL